MLPPQRVAPAVSSRVVGFLPGSLLLFLLLAMLPAAAQEPSADGLSGPALDRRDSELVGKLSAGERESLDRKLRLALSLYYDGAFRLAQPIFQDVATRADTMDVLYWLGRCAARAGDQATAISSFKAMLQRYPGLANVREELAQAYDKSGASGLAEEQRQLARQSGTAAENSMAAADAGAGKSAAQRPRFAVQFRGTLGLMYDDNVSVQPDVDKVDAPGGGSFTGTRALKDWATVANLNLDSAYDINGRGEWFWHNVAGYYAQFYHAQRNFDFDQLDLRSGIDWIRPNQRIRVPVGFLYRDYGNQMLSDSWYAEPTYERDLSKSWTFLSSYRFEAEHFSSDLRAGQNDKTSSITIGPAWHGETGKFAQLVAVKGLFARSLASADPFSYRDWGLAPSWLGRFSSGLEVLVEGRYVQRRFDAPASGFLDRDHEDKRVSLSTIASYPFGKRYMVGAWYTYTKSSSTVPLFAFTKSIIGVNLGITLDR